MNFDPAALFTVTRALSVEAGLNVAPLDSIVQLGGIQYLTTTGNQPSTERRGSIFSGFDLPTFVQTAFKKLQSDVELSVDVTIGDYKTTLQYTQNSVPTTTDDSLNLLLPVLARPIVQKNRYGSHHKSSTKFLWHPTKRQHLKRWSLRRDHCVSIWPHDLLAREAAW